MPLCLVVIALLALTAATLSQSLQTATARAQLQKDVIDFEWSMHNLEQQVVWRSVLERAVVNAQFDGQAISGRTATLIELSGPWDKRSTPMEWQSLYENEDLENDRYEVTVQDTRGLLDINYPSESYLSFALRSMDIPPSKRRRALEEIRSRISDFQALRIVGDEGYRTNTVTGLTGIADLCGLETWGSFELCDAPVALAKYLTFGSGSLPNIKLTPDSLRDEMGVRAFGSSDAALISDWERVQQREGFYDPLLASGPGGSRFHVWLHDQSTGTQRFFELHHSLDPNLSPFRITQRFEGAVAEEE
ncbi:MAG: hypothetical protein ACE37M_13025 [Henriciella sp.]